MNQAPLPTRQLIPPPGKTPTPAQEAATSLQQAQSALTIPDLPMARTCLNQALEHIEGAARENTDLADAWPTMAALEAAHEAALEAAGNVTQLIPQVDSKMAHHRARMAHPNNLCHAKHATNAALKLLTPHHQVRRSSTTTLLKLLTPHHQVRRSSTTTLLAATTAVAAAVMTAAYGAAALLTIHPAAVPEPTWWPQQYTWPSDLAGNPLAATAHAVTATGFTVLTAVNSLTALSGRWTNPATLAALAAVAAALLPQLALLTTVIRKALEKAH